MKSKLTLVTIIMLVLSVFVGAVAAQDEDDNTPRRHLRSQASEIIEIVTEATGLTRLDILEQLQNGDTLTTVIENTDADLDAVIAEVEAHLTARIETASENGRISEAQAATFIENLPEMLDTIFNTSPELGERGNRQRVRGQVLRVLIQTVTDETGLTPQELAQAIREDGRTLAEVLEANDADVDTVVISVMADVTEAVNERLESGDLTSEQAANILENLEETLTGWLNGELELPSHRRGGRH